MKIKIIKPLLLILFIVIVVIAVKYSGITANFNQEFISGLIMDYGIYGPIIFIFLYIIATLFFLPATPLTLASGFIFGSVFGTLYTVIGASIGAMIAFLFARFLGKDFVDKLLKKKFGKLAAYDKKLEKNGFLTTLFLRLVPLFPFNGLNFALGITKTKFRHFSLATVIGIIPGSFILANIGATATDLRSPKLYIFIGLFILLAFIPTIIKKLKNEKR